MKVVKLDCCRRRCSFVLLLNIVLFSLPSSPQAENSKSAEANFLGENSNLVNLDNLAQPASGGVSKSSSLMAINPFVTEDNRSNSSPTGQSANPFAAKGPQKSLNEMRASTAGHPASGGKFQWLVC